MPELPDLTIYAENLRPALLGKPIVQAEIFNRIKVNATSDAFRAALVGQHIEAIDRDGKELFFRLSNGNTFSVHLMLAGRFALLPWLDIHAINQKIIAIGFDDGQALAVSDFRGMCKVTLNPPPAPAPDALSEAFTYDYFAQQIHKNPRMNIKAFLINQRIVRGIGNAYVDEILWKADISPKSIAGKIPEEDLRALYDAIPWIMNDAIAQIEQINPTLIAGEERSFLRVHQPRKKLAADGEPILCEEIEKKRTYFTKKQRLFI